MNFRSTTSPVRVQQFLVAILAAFALLCAASASAGAEMVHLFSFGGPGQMNMPAAVATGPDGTIYVADKDNNRILRYSEDGSTLLDKWGSFGIQNGQFKEPKGIAVSPEGEVYVADTQNSRVQVFSASGAWVGGWGSHGVNPTQFWYPEGIDVGPNGRVYVADTGNHRVTVFQPSGQFLITWGSQGQGDLQFQKPTNVSVSSKGDIFVGDTGNQRLQVFSEPNVYKKTWGGPGQGPGQFSGSPRGIDIDPSGSVYVADAGNFRIQHFTRLGAFSEAWGTIGTDPGEFIEPRGVAVSPNGRVIVADTGNNRIQVFGVPPLAPVELWVKDGDKPGKTALVGGKALEGSTVQVFADKDCSGVPIATVSAVEFTAGVSVPLGDPLVYWYSARTVNSDDLTSTCASPVPYERPETGDGEQFPPIPKPTKTIVGFDGKNLHIRLFCPKRFKPACQSKVMPVTKRGPKGKSMAVKPVKVKIGSGKWKNVKVVVKPAFRAKLKAMTAKNVKLLHVKQVIRSKRIRSKKAKGTKTVFHSYKVRSLR